MSFDINILVNGSRCKLYNHRGKTYVEAKEGSEYVVEIKNNSWEKVLAVVSVDGLNVVDGKTAEENGPGYVMDRYTAQKLYGFQYSQDKVATFKFGAFGAKDVDGNPLGYAASKKDGSEKNAGVIGVKIWDEVPKPQPVIPPNPYPPAYWQTSSFAISCSFSATSTTLGGMPTIIRSATTYSPNPSDWQAGGVTYRCSANSGMIKSNLLQDALADAKAVRQTNLASPKEALESAFQCSNDSMAYCSQIECDNVDIQPDMASFDMETQWGSSRNYKVKEVEFERRNVVHSFDIYYASRESLIAMGIDLSTEKRVSFPESFKENKYAKPPKGWKA